MHVNNLIEFLLPSRLVFPLEELKTGFANLTIIISKFFFADDASFAHACSKREEV